MDQILSVIQVGRFFYLYRIWLHIVKHNEERALKICQMCLVDYGDGFLFKAEMKKRPFLIVLGIVLFVTFLFGYALRTFEL